MGLCLSLSLRMRGDSGHEERRREKEREEKRKRREGGLFLSQNGSKLVPNQPWQQHMLKSAATNSS